MSNTGKVSQVIGAVVDLEFEGKMPDILNAVKVVQKGDASKGIPDLDITLEVASHLGDSKVRTIAMQPTDGMVRGMVAVDTGMPITVPVGKGALGRILNVVGEPVDNLGPVNAEKRLPIHRAAQTSSPRNRLLRSSKPALRSSTCSFRLFAAARWECSAEPESERRLLSWR